MTKTSNAEKVKKLTFEDVKGRMNWIEIVQYYFPKMTDECADSVLWNQTCFPMSTDETLNQLYELWKIHKSQWIP